ncbi:MAG: ribonuclease J [Alphaproteobacteria bacterium]
MSDPDVSQGLYFLPLGGSGEIGMNLNLFALDGRWLMVDLGVTFGNETTPGVDVITPDPAFIRDHADALEAIVLTHAHEDHLGAVAHLWPELGCPIYATPFTAAVLRNKLAERGLVGKVPVNVMALGSRFQVGPFDIEYVTVTHSIPEPNALAIRTPYGTVLHTGDWKFDPRPLLGEPPDTARLRAVGDEGVLALIGDSTNAPVPGHSGSESDVRDGLAEVIAGCSGRVAVACFASNVARVESVVHAATVNGRQVALAGRSLWRMTGAAREAGYLQDVPPFLEAEDAAYLPDDEILYICTGSQGEARAALPRIARDAHPQVRLDPGDTVVFSSRVIPGNELAIASLQASLVRAGVRLVTWEDAFVHVSGHPAQDELRRMYELVRPAIAVPVHGEARHMAVHGSLARACGVDQVIEVRNGDCVRLAPGKPATVARVHAGRLWLRQNRLTPEPEAARLSREEATGQGSAVVTLALRHDHSLADLPLVTSGTLVEGVIEGPVKRRMQEAVQKAVEAHAATGAQDDQDLRDSIEVIVQKAIFDAHGQRPAVDVHVVRI